MGNAGDPFSEGATGFNPFAAFGSGNCILCGEGARQFVFLVILAASLAVLWTIFED